MKYYFSCPKCKSDESFSKVNEDPSLGAHGLLSFLFFGLFSLLILANERAKRIQCAHCGYIFKRPPLPSSPVAKTVNWFILLPLLAIFLTLLFLSSIDFNTWANSQIYILKMQEMIESNSQLFAIGILILLILQLAFWLIIGTYANVKFRNKLRKKYLTQPDEHKPEINSTSQNSTLTE